MAAHAEPPPVVCWNHLLKQACTYGRHCKREHLELDDTALFAGIGRSFQIWLPARYRERETAARSRARTDGLPSLRLGGAHRPPGDTDGRR